MAEKISDIARVVGKYLDKQGRNTSYIPYSAVIQECLAWYRGANSWHKYRMYNGRRYKTMERATLNMAKYVCQDLASLMMTEKVKIQLSDEVSQKLIDNVLEDNNFYVMANNLKELMFALGTSAYVESLQGDKAVIDYIHGDLIFPLKWDNGEIIDCAFAKMGHDTKDAVCTLILHELVDREDGQGKEYKITTIEIDEQGDIVPPIRFKDGIKDSNIESVVRTGTDIPFFQISKPNIVNNFDKTNPLGMSVIWNNIDTLKSIDIIFDSLRNEYKTGKKRIFVNSGLKSIEVVNRKDAKNKVVDCIDANDTEFYSLPTEDNGEIPIKVFDPLLRVAEHEQGLNTNLNLLSRGVTLGDGFYEFSNGKIARTATEVVSINSSLFRNLKRHEIIERKALIGMTRALLYIYNVLNGGIYDYNQNITVNFDDSIIEDTDKEKQTAMLEYDKGIIDKVEYISITRDMTRQQAMKFVKEMEATETMKDVSVNFGGFGGVNEFSE